MYGVLRGYRCMEEIMTCESCGCSFVDVESEDYTEVFTTGLCCECILEENWGNRMKFIGNFYLCFIGFATIWAVTLVFVSKASIYSWGAAIAVSISCALIINHYDGKHDDWLFCQRQQILK